MGEQPGFMNIKKVSTYLGIKVSTIYAMVEEKGIPHYRIGRLIRFKKSDIEQWMGEQRQGVVDANVEAKKIIGSLQKRSTQDVDRIVKKAVEEAKGNRYILGNGKPDRIKGLRREVPNGSL